MSSAPATAPKLDYIGAGLFLSICLGSCYLGVWQVQRYYWKIDLINKEKLDLEHNACTVPVNISQQEFGEWSKQLMGKRVILDGEFLHRGEVLLGPRSGHKGVIGAGAQGMASNPQGYYVVTPFKRSDGSILFVSRGWVPLKTESWSRPVGPIQINAVISEHEKKTAFSPDNDLASGRLLWLQPEILPKVCGVPDLNQPDAPIVVAEQINDDVDPMTKDKEYPVAKRAKDIGHHHISPTIHFVYAVTWFSLAVAGLAMTYFKFKPKRVRIRTPRQQ